MSDLAFKITLVGDDGVGKTTFLDRVETGPFESRCVATESGGLSARPIRRHTRSGRRVVYNMWDGAGQEKNDSTRATAAWAGTDAFLVLFDLTSCSSYTNAARWIERVQASHPTVPIVLVGTKSESPSRKFASNHICLPRRFGIPYVEVSGNTNAIDAPFECLDRLLID